LPGTYEKFTTKVNRFWERNHKRGWGKSTC
jgi:hypothetical protein